MEYVMLDVIHFWASGHDGVLSVACPDLNMCGNDSCTFVLLQSGVRSKINDIGFSDIIRGSSFNPSASLVAYSRLPETDWY